jgi:hypothetical protein
MTRQCRICQRRLDRRTHTAGGETCFDCATVDPARLEPIRARLANGTWIDRIGQRRCYWCGANWRKNHNCKATCEPGEIYPTTKTRRS